MYLLSEGIFFAKPHEPVGIRILDRVMETTSQRVTPFEPRWLPLSLGSLPHTDALRAWNVLLKRLPLSPTWPRLPYKSPFEDRYVQFSERFPGLVLEEGGRLHVDHQHNLERGLERLYLAYLEDQRDYGRISSGYAAGLEALRRGEVSLTRPPLLLAGVVTGPVSWALTVRDEHGRPILHDRILLEAVAKHLRLKVAWMEDELRRWAPHTLILLDEPHLTQFSPTSLPNEQTIALFEEVLSGSRGLKGIHACGPADWGLILKTSANVLSLDAYAYADSLLPHSAAVTRFLERRGIIAWGIVPASEAAEQETVESLVTRLEGILETLVEAGVPREALYRRGLISPSCGLEALTPALAERVLDLTAAVSQACVERFLPREEKAKQETSDKAPEISRPDDVTKK